MARLPGSKNSGKTRAEHRVQTRIQRENERKILDSALDLFSRYGLRGTTIEEVAKQSGLSKSNLFYYYANKREIYLAVLSRTLETWLDSLDVLKQDDDPEDALTRYILEKLSFSKTHPAHSRLFASEVLQGAPNLKPILETRLKEIVDEKAKIIESWIKQGKIVDVDPRHVIFMIWAATQHYADFAPQIEAVLPNARKKRDVYKDAKQTVVNVLLGGLLKK